MAGHHDSRRIPLITIINRHSYRDTISVATPIRHPKAILPLVENNTFFDYFSKCIVFYYILICYKL